VLLINWDPNVSIIVNKYKILYINYLLKIVENMGRYLTPRTVFIIVKFWTMGATVFTFGVVLPLGVFRVARCISD